MLLQSLVPYMMHTLSLCVGIEHLLLHTSSIHTLCCCSLTAATLLFSIRYLLEKVLRSTWQLQERESGRQSNSSKSHWQDVGSCRMTAEAAGASMHREHHSTLKFNHQK